MSNAKNTQSKEAQPSDKQVEKNSPPVKSKQSSGKGLAVFAFLFSLLAVAGAGFTWYQTQIQSVQANTKIAVGVTEIAEQVKQMEGLVKRVYSEQAEKINRQQLTSQLKTVAEDREKALTQITNQINGLEDKSQELEKAVQTRSGHDYVVQEVSQLLKLANHKINFSGDVNLASKALELAAQQLQELDDPRYAQALSKINAELAELNSVSLPDVTKLSAMLNKLSQQVPALPLQNEPKPRMSAEQLESAPEKIEMTWKTELRQLWLDLISAIQIQRVDTPPKPLLATEQRYFLNGNIQLRLAGAQVALLKNNEQVYKQEINTALVWLKGYFDVNNEQVVNALKQLEFLEAQQIEVQLPNITGSYDVFVKALGRG